MSRAHHAGSMKAAGLVALASLMGVFTLASLDGSAAPPRRIVYPNPHNSAPPLTDDDYWVIADRLADALDNRWDADKGGYASIGGNDPTSSTTSGTTPSCS